MRFFTSINPPREYLEGKAPPPELMAAMGPFIQQLIDAGSLISTAGLKSVSQGTRIRATKGKVAIVDGPFAEAKEMIGGYAILEAPSREAAIAIATDFVNLHITNGIPDLSVEIREIDGGFNY